MHRGSKKNFEPYSSMTGTLFFTIAAGVVLLWVYIARLNAKMPVDSTLQSNVTFPPFHDQNNISSNESYSVFALPDLNASIETSHELIAPIIQAESNKVFDESTLVLCGQRKEGLLDILTIEPFDWMKNDKLAFELLVREWGMGMTMVSAILASPEQAAQLLLAPPQTVRDIIHMTALQVNQTAIIPAIPLANITNTTERLKTLALCMQNESMKGRLNNTQTPPFWGSRTFLISKTTDIVAYSASPKTALPNESKALVAAKRQVAALPVLELLPKNIVVFAYQDDLGNKIIEELNPLVVSMDKIMMRFAHLLSSMPSIVVKFISPTKIELLNLTVSSQRQNWSQVNATLDRLETRISSHNTTELPAVVQTVLPSVTEKVTAHPSLRGTCQKVSSDNTAQPRFFAQKEKKNKSEAGLRATLGAAFVATALASNQQKTNQVSKYVQKSAPKSVLKSTTEPMSKLTLKHRPEHVFEPNVQAQDAHENGSKEYKRRVLETHAAIVNLRALINSTFDEIIQDKTISSGYFYDYSSTFKKLQQDLLSDLKEIDDTVSDDPGTFSDFDPHYDYMKEQFEHIDLVFAQAEKAFKNTRPDIWLSVARVMNPIIHAFNALKTLCNALITLCTGKDTPYFEETKLFLTSAEKKWIAKPSSTSSEERPADSPQESIKKGVAELKEKIETDHERKGPSSRR